MYDKAAVAVAGAELAAQHGGPLLHPDQAGAGGRGSAGCPAVAVVGDHQFQSTVVKPGGDRRPVGTGVRITFVSDSCTMESPNAPRSTSPPGDRSTFTVPRSSRI